MRRIRIGTDIEIRWPILTNGKSVPLTGRNLRLILENQSLNRQELDFDISDNVIISLYRGMEHEYLGRYTLTLWENFGEKNQSAVDCSNAFELVRRTSDTGGFDDGVTTQILELEGGDIIAGLPGYSAYEIAVKHGYEGTEEEWLASLVGPKGDAFTYNDFTPEQIKELQKPATDTITQLQTTDNAVEKNELNRQTAEQQREENETQRSSTFNELSQNLSTAISNANSASQKVTEAVANIPVTIKTIKETTDINI